MNVVGIDLGGTHLRAGRLGAVGLGPVSIVDVPANGTAEQVMATLTALIDQLEAGGAIDSIGIGVPSLVDPDSGVVAQVPNIPSWKDVPLKQTLEERYGKPVHVLNDASAFTLGEQRFGAARNRPSVVGLTLGTGTGAGLIVDGKLVMGRNGGAGEVGMLPYLDHTYEHYTSGQFFVKEHETTGEETHRQALAGDEAAQAILSDLGYHIGRLCHAVVMAYDPELIVLGGSLLKSAKLWQDAMNASLREFPYPGAIERLQLVQHELEHPGVVGAASFARERSQRR